MVSRVRRIALASTVLFFAVGLPCRAFPANGGHFDVPLPEEGMGPSMTSDAGGAGCNAWNALHDAIIERVKLRIDEVFQGGAALTLGSTNLYLDYAPELQMHRVSVRLSPFVMLSPSPAGRYGGGMQAYVDWKLGDAWTLTTSPGLIHDTEALRLKVDMALDYRILPWLSVDAELLAGAPSWNFGYETALGMAPGVTIHYGRTKLQGSVLFPIVKAASSSTLAAPTAVTAVSYSW